MATLDNQMDIAALVEMGFSRERVEQALNSTKNQGIQPAIEWLFSHPVADADNGQKLGGMAERQNESHRIDVDENKTALDGSESSASTDANGAGSAVALSLVCEDCGKQIRSEMDAQAHAARTGHQNFAESSEAIKPLTEEEKTEQKKRLHEKLEERRKQRIASEKQQDKEREKGRRRTGKETSQAKDDHAYQEMKRIADERKKEKMEEKRLKQRLKEEIAKDRAELKAKQQPSTSAAVKTSTPTSQPNAASKKEYNSCRIQFRLTDGSTHNSNFKTDDILELVYTYIAGKKSDGNMPFSLSTTFPRKTFTEQDMSKTLKELGLVPSAVLVLGKT